MSINMLRLFQYFHSFSEDFDLKFSLFPSIQLKFQSMSDYIENLYKKLKKKKKSYIKQKFLLIA